MIVCVCGVCVCMRKKEREVGERMVVVDDEFSLPSSTEFILHLGPFGHQGMPKSYTLKVFP